VPPEEGLLVEVVAITITAAHCKLKNHKPFFVLFLSLPITKKISKVCVRLHSQHHDPESIVEERPNVWGEGISRLRF
jgi:hypothetical protein